MPTWVESLPAVNATLNGLSAILLVLGYVFIRRRQVGPHQACMVGAFVVSALFLACYLLYHYYAGSRRFPGTGTWRIVYFAILIPHIILAVLMLPPIAMTFARAFRDDFAGHVWWARRSLPVWLYVSVTGVLVYWMLYQVRWS